MGKSFQLIRTNPRLTTNIKYVVSSNYNMYLESFNSSKELSDDKYKHYLLSIDSELENDIPKFYSGLPKNIAFSPIIEDDIDIMYTTYENQFDTTYISGADEIEDTSYSEEFEYFAPLYISKNNIPSNFIVMRIDDPNIYEKIGIDYTIGSLSRNNFRSEIIDKWKCVTNFDLSNKTALGQFIDRNVNDNSRFPEFSFFFDTKKYNYSKWSGLEYKTGVYRTSDMFLDDKLHYENLHFNLEEFITNGFENSGIIYPYIFNFKFLFDDIPATADALLKYTMNRYYGFYTDNLELIKTMTTYKLPSLVSSFVVKNNIILNNILEGEYISPFSDSSITSDWVQVGINFYKVNIQTNGSYRIISDINLNGLTADDFDDNIQTITDNILSDIGVIDEYISDDNNNVSMYADLYLIEINGEYHVLKNNYTTSFDDSGEIVFDNSYYIQTDYSITSNDNILKYYKGGEDNIYTTTLDVFNDTDGPIIYNIYRVDFTDIKDFDFDRINTSYSDFDYEKSSYVDTLEDKLKAVEYRDDSIPKRNKLHGLNQDGQYSLMNISSEYTAGDETFEIKNNKTLNSLWCKNQSICKWGYKDSISHSDYPYKLNNSFEIGGEYNRTVNTELKTANIKSKNLDYFYRIGDFITNDDTSTINGFTQDTFNTDWTSIQTTWNIANDNTIVVKPTNAEQSILINNNIILDINEYYYISITVTVISGNVPPIGLVGIGISVDTFDNLYSSITNGGTKMTLNGIRRAKNTTLKLECHPNITEGNISDISIYKLDSKIYLNQSTNIQTGLFKTNDSTNDDRFNLNHYINSDFDYFDYFFKNNMEYNDYGKELEKPYQKYAIFNSGDGDLPTTALFKGIEYNLYGIEDIVLNETVGGEETISSIITSGGEDYNGYKIAIIMSENYDYYQFDNINDEYSNPELLYSYNNSINGILPNHDKNNIHIFLNKKYKNILIILNQNIPINYDWLSLNNIDKFGENYGLYKGETLDGHRLYPGTSNVDNEYEPDNITAYNFINAINNLNNKGKFDNYIFYHFIDEDKTYVNTQMVKFSKSTFSELSDWDNKFPPFIITINTPLDLTLKKNSYNRGILNLPKTNLSDKFLVFDNNVLLSQSIINDPLSRYININEVDYTTSKIYHGETISNTTIKRYTGFYEPIFHNIPMFRPTYYWQDGDDYKSISGNCIFADNLEQFGIINETMYSKVNNEYNVLKLKDTDTDRSIYPMVDEIGLSQTSRFIFLSSWDSNFFIKTIKDTTFLSDFITTEIEDTITPIYAQIVSVELSGITNDSTIEGSPTETEPLDYIIGIKNISSIDIVLDLTMKYISNTITIIGISLADNITTLSLTPNEIFYITPLVNRPIILNNNLLNYSEYTNWGTYFEISHNGDILDSDNSVKLSVYNDIINFELSNPNVTNGFQSTHYVGDTYDFSIDLAETNMKLNNINYFAELYILNVVSDVYELISVYDGYVTDSETITFTDVLIPISGLVYDTIDNTKIKYIVKHDYDIEGITKYVSTEFITPNDIIIRRHVEVPVLTWGTESGDTSFKITLGSCNGTVYSGDIFTDCTVKIINTGGTYYGGISLTYSIIEDGVVISTTIENGFDTIELTNNGSQSYTTSIGPINSVTGQPFITYHNRNYSIKVNALEINSITTSPKILGMNDGTPNCN